MSWVAAAVAASAAIGAGASLYGANKQAQAVADTNRLNQSQVDKANQIDWNNFLLQRGLNAGGAAPTGVIPTTATPVNTRLPLWMNVAMPQTPAAPQNRPNVPLFVKRGG